MSEEIAVISKPTLLKRIGNKAKIAVIGGSTLIVGAASNVHAQEMNLTPMVDLMNQVPALITPIGSIITAVLPIMFELMIYSFIVGILGAILSGITAAFVFNWRVN